MEQGNFRKFLREAGLFVADIFYNAIIIIILVVLIRNFLISPFRVVGSSMADTLANKEFILIDKLSYTVGDVDRGDPVVFLPPATSKDTPKFEELISMDQSGTGILDFSGLIKLKDADYCKGILGSFWFCQEKVEKDDLLYYAPQRSVSGSSAKETDWERANSLQIGSDSYKNGSVALNGEAGKTYSVRVYDSMGQEYFVKRVIGVPGDTVKIDSGRVYLKGPNDADFVQIEEAFLNSENLNRTYISQKQRQNVYEVPEGHYFVMGDNRNHSNDSRSWLEPITHEAFPYVPEANLNGKVLVVLWPMLDFRFIGSADF
jgi:signal peptidase I